MQPPGTKRLRDRTYLHLRMRPLSTGAMQPARGPRVTRTATVVAVAVAAGLIVLAAPFIFFLAVFGDPYGRGFVERRSDGLYAQLRPCEGDSVHTVDVSRYDASDLDPPPPFWSAAASEADGVDAVLLFAATAGVETSSTGEREPSEYLVVINQGRGSEAFVTVAEDLVSIGEVEYGGQRPVPTATYLEMPNSDFGCAP